MDMKNKIIYLYLFLSTLLFFFPSCTEKELGGCPNLSIHLEYWADGSTDVLQKHIANATYYIYTEQGKLVQKGTLSSDLLNRPCGFQLKLDPGEYHFVCWGNLEHYCLVNRDEQLEQAYIYTAQQDAESYPQSFDPLYFGEADITITDMDQMTKITPHFHGAHVTMWLYVKGFKETDEQGRQIAPHFYLSNFEAEYDFHGLPRNQQITYYPESVYKEEDDVLMAYCHLPRFDEQTTSMIHLYSGVDHRLVETVDLRKFIDNNNIKLTGKEEVDIPILLEFHDLDCMVTLPDWDEEEAKPIL